MQKSIKQAITFLPGWGFKASLWQDISRDFSHHDIQQLDLPLHSLDVNHMLTELSNNIPDNSIIVAWSLSGLLAILLCHHLPHKCSKLILVNSTAFFATDANWSGIPLSLAKRFRHKARRNLTELMTQFIQLVIYPKVSASLAAIINLHLVNSLQHQQSLLNYLDLLLTVDYRHLFKNLTLPVYCIFGGKDAIIPVIVASQMSLLNENSTIKIIAEAGHAPFLTHKLTFNKLLTAILHAH